uniref:succinate dehydrogenase subunit 4 n=1 Tax=Bostrychia moritziana TaxID=103713 RepID=UPI002E774BE6|nr:succinate dehydrogenase subunit 4 [Bostrychia moritziana]WQF69399.1 succinate dehydrogenase subunit 4 [Bostrychia moritziana]WQF69422.1 succinate dehydrogenase subunit 4 [Bostrychia moritziana]
MFSLFLDCELSLILYNFLILHFVFGLVAIFNDYVYRKQVRVLLVFIIKILAINLSCFFFEMVF